MSLGVNREVEDQIQRCVAELGRARAIEVAWWRFQQGMKLLCMSEVGTTMLAMEERGVLAFVDGRYEVVKQE